MLKTLTLASMLSLAAPFAAQATTIPVFGDFTLADNGGDGSVTTTPTALGFDFSFALSGSDTDSGSAIDTSFIAIAPADTLVSFDWSYTTLDDEASYDPFGYSIGGFNVVLTDGDVGAQSGSFAFSVAAGQSFGWFANTIDDEFGRATSAVDVRFTEVASAVPLPAAAPLLAGGLGALALARRRRRLA